MQLLEKGEQIQIIQGSVHTLSQKHRNMNRLGPRSVTAHSHPPTEGFAVDLNNAVEKRAYPHHARNKVAAVPEPRYEMQWEFNPTNPAFKGFGVDYHANRQRQKQSQVVLGEESTAPDWIAFRRPQHGVNLSAIGIDRDTHTFGGPSAKKEAPHSGRQPPPPPGVSHSTSLRPMSSVEPMAIHSARRQRHADPAVTAIVNEPSRTAVSAQPSSRERPASSLGGSGVASCLTGGETVLSPAPIAEKPQRMTLPAEALSTPRTARPETASARLSQLSGASNTQQGELFRRKMSKDDMWSLLRRCGKSFEAVTKHPSRFEEVWAAAVKHEGGNDASISVNTIRLILDQFGW